jgi:hypothetical protein
LIRSRVRRSSAFFLFKEGGEEEESGWESKGERLPQTKVSSERLVGAVSVLSCACVQLACKRRHIPNPLPPHLSMPASKASKGLSANKRLVGAVSVLCCACVQCVAA